MFAQIIQGLRAFSRDSIHEPKQSADLNRLLLETVDLCRESLKNRHIEIRLTSQSGQSVYCRPVQLSQVLLNLLNNSKDAVSSLPEKWVEVVTETHPHCVRITVTDSGPGIAPDLIEKIMQPFFTTKDIGKGTGLGLSISKGLIEGQGGRLFYDHNHPHTRFVIELPIETSAIV